MTANGIETYFLFFRRRISRYRNRCARAQLRGGLWDRRVANMADLTMLFVRRVLMPVPSCLHGKQAHGKNQGYRQQSYGDSLGHYKL